MPPGLDSSTVTPRQPSGRFAPSPTGPLHMGSLVTALASYLHIKQRGGTWQVRIDDLDPPRQDPTAAPKILAALDAHGFATDGEVQFQSTHQDRYAATLARLNEDLYYCTCSRKSLAGLSAYPGTCRDRRVATTEKPQDAAIRLSLTNDVSFQDGIVGSVLAKVGFDFGDPIVVRKDGLWAYHFATAIDDGSQFSDVLRGQDLLASTATQIAIMDRLELAVPRYTHIPVLCYADGAKLSKQSHAPPLDDNKAVANLVEAYRYLGLMPSNAFSNTHDLLRWGASRFQLGAIPAALPYYRTHA